MTIWCILYEYGRRHTHLHIDAVRVGRYLLGFLTIRSLFLERDQVTNTQKTRWFFEFVLSLRGKYESWREFERERKREKNDFLKVLSSITKLLINKSIWYLIERIDSGERERESELILRFHTLTISKRGVRFLALLEGTNIYSLLFPYRYTNIYYILYINKHRK